MSRRSVASPLFLLVFSSAAAPAFAWQGNKPFVGRWFSSPSPNRLVAADVNGDNIPDVITASPSTGQLGIHLGDSAGNFQTGIVVPQSGAGLVDLQTADVNNDGKSDVIISFSQIVSGQPPFYIQTTKDRIEIRLSTGTGLAAATTINFPDNTGIGRICVKDSSGDGIPDIVISTKGFGAVNPTDIPILVNNGNGTFAAPIYRNVGVSSIDVQLSDLDGDGLNDLIVSPEDLTTAPGTALRVLRSGGAPLDNFSVLNTYEMGGVITRGFAADIDGDSKLDILALLQTTAPYGLSARVGDGQGNFGPSVVTPTGAWNGIDYVAADFNEDGTDDVALASSFVTNNVTIWFGAGAAAFTVGPLMNFGNLLMNLVATDLNGDGHLDLVTSHFGSDSIATWLAFGPAKYHNVTSIPLGNAASTIRARDFNNDGDVDFATIGNPNDAVKVMLSNATPAGLPTWGAPSNYTLHSNAFQYHLATGDIDGDGYCDIATVHSYPFEFNWLMNQGNGTFGAPHVSFTPTYYPDDVELADVNGDGMADLVIIQTQLPTATYNNYTISVYLAIGGGGFNPVPTQISLGGPGSDLTMGDLNLDGNLDAAVKRTNYITACLGDGAGGFSSLQLSAAASTFHYLNIAEMNGDGLPDIVVNGYGVRTFAGNGAGLFTPIGSIAGSPTIGFGENALLDADGDGNMDFVGTEYANDRFDLFLSDGAGNFAAPQLYITGNGPVPAIICDVNKDGKPDIAIGTAGNNSIYNMIMLHLNVGELDGIQRFGTGIAGCSGAHEIGVNTLPKVGDANFRFTCTNAPTSTLGLALGGSIADPLGPDLFSLGLPIYISILSPDFGGFDFYSYGSGYGVCPAPIPNNPLIAGMQFSAQAIWYWAGGPCAPTPIGLSSSGGITITIH